MKHLTFRKKDKIYFPLKFWRTDPDTEVAIYQGERGERPDLDFIVKYKEGKKRLRTPSHTHWIFDILVKASSDKENSLKLVNDYLKIYDESEPFRTIQERNSYDLKKSSLLKPEYSHLNNFGHYSLATLTAFIELFSICEKQSPNAFMFKTLLDLVKDYCEGKKDFYQIVGYSKRV